MIGRGTQLFVDVLEVTECLLFMTEYLDDLLTCHHLLDEAVDTRQTLLLGTEMTARPFTELRGGNHHHHSHQDTHQCQGNAQYNHGSEGGDDGDDG